MQLIKFEEAIKDSNSDKCKTLEYSFIDRDIDLGIAEITGRYPSTGYCKNLISKELIYVIAGTGVIYFEDKEVAFTKGDAILIDVDEKYYWETLYCKISMSCTPAWTIEQHVLTD